MEAVSITSSSATVIIELNELLVVRNALIEVLNYLNDSDYHARTGYYAHEGEVLLSLIENEIMMIKAK